MSNLWLSLIVMVALSLWVLPLFRWSIPVIALMWVIFAWTVPTYLGYPIDSHLVGNRQALVLNVSKAPDNLYVTVVFTGETEPRLVVIPNTKANDEATQSSSLNSGPKIIQFNGSNQVANVDLNNSDQFKK